MEYLFKCNKSSLFLNRIREIYPDEILGEWNLRDISGIIVLVGKINKVSCKYGDRGLRFALRDLVAILQNIHLAAAAENITCCAIGGYYDDMIDKFLELEYPNETTLLTIFIEKMEVFTLVANKNFFVIEDKEDSVLMRNNITEALVSMSKIERDLLLYYIYIKGDIISTITYFKEYSLEKDIILQVIEKAKDLKIVVNIDYNEVLNRRKPNIFITSQIQYLLVKSLFLINYIFKIDIVPLLQGDMRFYKVLSINLKYSFVNRIFLNRIGQISILILFFSFLFFRLYF